jgi:16S rRNA (guanine527-N7)-methyltransferase
VIDQLKAASGRDVSRETFDRLAAFVDLVEQEADRQNLISKATLASIWQRHIVDSAQLIRFEPFRGASWVDIGSGAGLPGIVLACMVEGSVTLVEPRKLRADFLHRACESLGLNARVVCAKAGRVSARFDAITARAVAPLPELLEISQHLSTAKTTWVLPKGRNASEELAVAKRAWHGTFHVEPSVTDADSFMIVATGVRAKR